MGRQIWTAEELGRLSPAGQDELFDASVVTDLNDVAAAFLARIRDRFHQLSPHLDDPP